MGLHVANFFLLDEGRYALANESCVCTFGAVVCGDHIQYMCMCCVRESESPALLPSVLLITFYAVIKFNGTHLLLYITIDVF